VSHSDEDQTIAIAGIYQATALTRSLGRDGKAPEGALQASIYSLLQIDAPDVGSVFKEIAGVDLGLSTLKSQMLDASVRDIELTRYFIALLQLEAKLARDRQRLDTIGRAIASLKTPTLDAEDSQVRLITELADIYSNNISTLSQRIMVKGEALYLQNDGIAARIRTSLLAGIRAVHLWRQLGGRRWHLFLRRKRILRCANRLLDHIHATSDVL
jgi:high frequency lysogenization protein